jgi:hypothetical protein
LWSLFCFPDGAWRGTRQGRTLCANPLAPTKKDSFVESLLLPGWRVARNAPRSDAARNVADYVLAELDSLGFDSALQPVTVPAARLTSTPNLIVDHLAFSPRRDFAELTAFSYADRFLTRYNGFGRECVLICSGINATCLCYALVSQIGSECLLR